MRKTVSQRMEQNESVMLSLELLMRNPVTTGHAGRAAFTQQLMQRYPHIYSIQFFEEVSREQAPAFVQRMKQRGLFDFQLKEPATGPAARMAASASAQPLPSHRDDRTPAGWLNSQLGMDINADGQHSETLRAAEQFGHMESTAPFALPDNGRGLFVGQVRATAWHRGGEPRQAFCRHPVAPRPAAGGHSAGQYHAHDISVVFYPRADRALTICFSARR